VSRRTGARVEKNPPTHEKVSGGRIVLP